MRKKAFVICPVRGVDPSMSAGYVAAIETEYDAHWPHRDTDQNDDTGYRICDDNRAAIFAADRVFVVWDGKSQGCLFDLGMAFAMGKPITVLETPALTEGKSFQNMMDRWSSLSMKTILLEGSN